MPLSHDERFALARDLCARYARATQAVRVGGVYGSTARGADTPWSDLELFLVVGDGSGAQGLHALYAGTALSATVVEEGELVARLLAPSPDWPIQMAILEDVRVLQGDAALPTRWLQMGREVPRERHLRALETALPTLVFESCGRIFSCQERGNRRDLHVSAVETLLEMLTALCLLNGAWVHHDYFGGIEDSFHLPRLPEGYRELAPALWDAREPAEAAALAYRLLDSFVALLRSEGVALSDWTHLPPEEWPLRKEGTERDPTCSGERSEGAGAVAGRLALLRQVHRGAGAGAAPWPRPVSLRRPVAGPLRARHPRGPAPHVAGEPHDLGRALDARRAHPAGR